MWNFRTTYTDEMKRQSVRIGVIRENIGNKTETLTRRVVVVVVVGRDRNKSPREVWNHITNIIPASQADLGLRARPCRLIKSSYGRHAEISIIQVGQMIKRKDDDAKFSAINPSGARSLLKTTVRGRRDETCMSIVLAGDDGYDLQHHVWYDVQKPGCSAS